ncbi:MAG: tetratricopeptide repeat protein [Cyanobium sp.]
MPPGAGRFGYLTGLVQSGRLTEAEPLIREVIAAGESPTLPGAPFSSLLSALIAAGLYDLADDVVGSALAADPGSLQAQYWLAMLHYQRGNLDQASSALDAVVLGDDGDPNSLLLLGLIRSAQGHLRAAIEAFERVLELRPCHPDALLRLGGLCRAVGDHAKALDTLSRAVDVSPSSLPALCELGIVLHQSGDRRGGVDCLRKAIAIDPACAEACLDLGRMLKQEIPVDYAAIKELFCRSLLLSGPTPGILNELALLYAANGSMKAARALYRSALVIGPGDAEIMVNLANTYVDEARYQLAREWYGKAIELDPQNPFIYRNLALSYRRQGIVASALESYRKALALAPDDVDSRLNVAICCFCQNDYEQGWREYECRLDSPAYRRLCVEPPVGLKRWQGEPLAAGSTLVLVAEQGIGDSFQFVRYSALLSRQGVSTVLCVPAALGPLFEASALAARVISPDQLAEVEEGAWLPLLSLPRLLGVRPDRPLITDPYLVVDDERRRQWRKRLADERRPIVALHWQGQPEAEVHSLRGRSFPLEVLRPLADRFGVSLVSLQKGAGSAQLAACSFRDRFVACQDEIDASWDFQDAAAILSCCDLVITSDSGLAHLAGAIGAPTWLLLHHMPDWRWGLESECTFWYSSVRLFRQVSEGDWPGVVDQVSAALEHEAGFTTRPPAAGGFLSAFWSWVELGEAGAVPPRNSRSLRARLSAAGSSFWRWLEASQDPVPAAQADASSRLTLVDRSSPLPADLPDLPDLIELRRKLARECLQCSQLTAARRLLQELCDAGLASADDHAGLGAISLLEDKDQEARQSLEQALAIRPDHPQALSNLGLACFQLGELDRARTLLTQAIELNPASPASHCNLALLHQSCGEVQQAIASYRQALALDPSLVTAHWHLAHSLFLIAAYQEAWPEHEWRLKDAPERKLQVMPLAPPLNFSAEALLQQGPLLLVSEQGIGDSLQFIRYVQLLQASGRQISLCLPEQLRTLVALAFPQLKLLTPDQARHWTDGPWLSLMSLPGILQDSPAGPRVTQPYLRADPLQMAAWRETFNADECRQPLVALNWQGNPAAEVGPLKGRSFPLQALAPLVASVDVDLLSLQKGSGVEQLQTCTFRDRFIPAQSEVDDVWDFQEIAAILTCCDLVITSDTALAHLAGGLGRPTWLLLPHIPDWRWGLEGETTFWYPSMRLFRQRAAGDWPEVMDRVAIALADFIASR